MDATTHVVVRAGDTVVVVVSAPGGGADEIDTARLETTVAGFLQAGKVEPSDGAAVLAGDDAPADGVVDYRASVMPLIRDCVALYEQLERRIEQESQRMIEGLKAQGRADPQRETEVDREIDRVLKERDKLIKSLNEAKEKCIEAVQKMAEQFAKLEAERAKALLDALEDLLRFVALSN